MPQSKDLVAASATPMILSILKAGESYGYAIAKEVRDVSDAQIEWTGGMLYPVLRRFESQGLLASFWQIAESGKKRRDYRISTAGEEAPSEQR